MPYGWHFGEGYQRDDPFGGGLEAEPPADKFINFRWIAERARPVGDKAREVICEHEARASESEARAHSEQRLTNSHNLAGE